MTVTAKLYFQQKFELSITNTDKIQFSEQERPLARKVADYVSDTLYKFNIENTVINNFFPYLEGVVANAFDSFARKEFVIGQKFTLDILIYQKGSEFIVEIIDNGLGFLKRKKGEEFEYDLPTDITNKGASYFLGGNGTGMFELINKGKDLGYKVRLKNGEKEGASVIMAFDLKPKLKTTPCLTFRHILAVGTFGLLASLLLLQRKCLS